MSAVSFPLASVRDVGSHYRIGIPQMYNQRDVQGYIKKRLYSTGGFRIISQTILECDFEHFYDQFTILEIRLAEHKIGD